jgi:hypothetical protein
VLRGQPVHLGRGVHHVHRVPHWLDRSHGRGEVHGRDGEV